MLNITIDTSEIDCTSNNISTPNLVSPPATNRIQMTTRCRTNSGARHLLNETEFTNKLYSKFNEGNLPHPPVEKERNFIDAQDMFLRRNKEIKLWSKQKVI